MSTKMYTGFSALCGNDGQESFLEPNGVSVVAAHRVNKKERPFIRTITETKTKTRKVSK